METKKLPDQAPSATEQPTSARLYELAGIFLRLGFTAFGGPAAHIAMMRQEVVQRRKWLSDERFMDMVGIVNLLPGPNSTELAIHVGFMRAGWRGLLVAGLCFICPAMLIVIALAWFYQTYGSLPAIDGALFGIKAAIIAIVIYALWGLLRSVLKTISLGLLATTALVCYYFFGVDTLLLIICGGLFYGLWRRLVLWRTQKAPGSGPTLSIILPLFPGTTIGRLLTTTPVTEVAMVAAPLSLTTLFFTFLKMGATLYGSGYVILAYLHNDFVNGLHWLTEQQLLDAIAVGQFTPGPVFTTATFVGYVIMGWQGALVASAGIFLPSFLFVAVIHPLTSFLRRSAWTAAILDGINAAALALMAGVTIQFAQQLLLQQDLRSNILASVITAVSLLLLFRFKLNSTWLILAGGLIGLLYVVFLA